MALGTVRQQLDQRRLVRDDTMNLLGMSLHQGQRAHRAPAGAQDHGRTEIEVRHQPGKIVGPHLRGRVLAGVVDRAAVDAPGVGGEHGVVAGQQVSQGAERPGVHRRPDQHHERTSAAHLVVQMRPRNLERLGGGGEG